MKTAAIIGAGFGGLALAIRLQSAGIATTIIEARDKPGGRGYYWEKDGFTFDGGPTVITDPPCLEELWALSGHKMADDIELMPVFPFYRLNWSDGTNFDYSNDAPGLKAEIENLNPDDVEGYRKFLEYSKGVYKEGYQKLGTVAFLKVAQQTHAIGHSIAKLATKVCHGHALVFHAVVQPRHRHHHVGEVRRRHGCHDACHFGQVPDRRSPIACTATPRGSSTIPVIVSPRNTGTAASGNDESTTGAAGNAICAIANNSTADSVAATTAAHHGTCAVSSTMSSTELILRRAMPLPYGDALCRCFGRHTSVILHTRVQAVELRLKSNDKDEATFD